MREGGDGGGGGGTIGYSTSSKVDWLDWEYMKPIV